MARLSTPEPSWFTPKKLLVIFCVINLINYMDRGAIASNGVNGSLGSCTESGVCTSGTGIQFSHKIHGYSFAVLKTEKETYPYDYIGVLEGDFNLNNFEDGILSSAFMVGLLVASPIFASLAKSVNPFRLIGVGLSVWTFAAAGCGVSFDFWSITICRMLVGVGEASFISLAAPFIDDNAPVAQKNAWLAMFYMCIPAGVAFGYVYGGVVGSYLSWRVAFFGEAILMLPFAVLGFFMKPLQLKGFSHAEVEKSSTATESTLSEIKVNGAGEYNVPPVNPELLNQDSKKPSKSKFSVINLDHVSTFLKDVKVLLLDKVYLVNILGYVAYNFVIGAYSYWGPKAGYNIYNMSDADLIFGGVTIVCGIFGTVGGGLILDKMGNTIPNAFRLLSVATLLGAAFCFAAFCFKNLYIFLAFFAIGELLVFATQGPVNFISLHCVKPSMRPLSMAIGTVSIHIFGDVPSSPLVGVLQDYVDNWRETTLILTSVLFLASGVWSIGVFLPSVDRFNEDSEIVETESSSTIPLLHERNAETINFSNEP